MVKRLCAAATVAALGVIGLSTSFGPAARAADPAAGTVDFERDIQPIFKAACYECHGDKKVKGKLRLDSRDLALKGGTTGPAIEPGKGKDSYLAKRLRGLGDEDQMPLDKPALTEEQIKLVERWIDQGAKWPEHASVQGAKIEKHWSFVKPVKHDPPKVHDDKWVRNAIDQFILARLEREGLKPSPEANRATLIRRLGLDLIGLPPTPEEVDAFVNDASPDAYEKLVDRLLASPHYGERWARRWLDLARYADTNGYEKDRPRSIWLYRDWVINALNADMPFDRFTVEQLAGDMLSDATDAQKIATGFHRNTMINEEGGIDPLEFRFHAVVDRVATTGTAFLGLTVGCAQCHTHKYDPISHKEYYQFFAFLNNADEPVMEAPTPEVEAKRGEIARKAEQLESELPGKFEVKDDVEWTVARSGTLTTITPQEKPDRSADGTWRLPDGGPEKSSYTVVFDSGPEEFDRIRLEALTDGDKGPGRTAHGNFVVNELTVRVATRGSSETPLRVKLARAEADYSQPMFDVAGAIDGKPETGWAINEPGKRKSRTAVFYFEKPVKNDAGSTWNVKLDQNFGERHTLGRFRLSLGRKVVTDKRPMDVRRAEALAKGFAVWQEKQGGSAVQWTALKPSRMASNAPTLALLEDGSVLVSGDVTKSDTYDLTLPLPEGVKEVTAVRIEALPHPSLPNNGPGKVHYEGPFGDFFLSEISLTASGQPAKFASAAHSYAAGSNTAARAIDGDQQSGWSIAGQQGKAHHAVFALEKPVSAKELNLRMLFEKYYAAPLGRFRVWVSDDPKAGKGAPLPPDVEIALATPADKRGETHRDLIFKQYLMAAPELSAARKEIDALRRTMPGAPTTLVMRERPSGHQRPTRLHHRGEFMSPRDEVAPGVPAVLPPLPEGAPRNRLGLAQWLVSRDNPLTPRVTVNRQWSAIFGKGLVKTEADFGTQGEKPSHPELLDYLAVEFMDQGWSLKKLHRLIVTSSTYRQSSAVNDGLLAKDPENRLLARGPRFRLEAELVRDSALKAAGLLSPKMGGPSVFPPQPPSVTTEGAYGPLTWTASTGEDRYRRSLYTFAKRTAPFALFNTFDAPSGEACVARREVSNTPLAALAVLNDVNFVEAAQALGKVIAAMQGDDVAKATALFRRFAARAPDPSELAKIVEFCQRQRDRFEKKELDASKVAGVAEGDVIERATWTAVARAVMNLDEVVTKN